MANASKTARQQDSKTARQQDSKTARQQDSKTARQQDLCKIIDFLELHWVLIK
jgi:hypothetical protein